MGTGPEIGDLAGRTFSEGKLYYIFVKDQNSAEMAGPLPSDLAQPEATR